MSKPNDIALAIDRTEGRSDTDTAAKTLLVFKEIQAAIVEMTIHEFMQYSRETIVKQTEFDYFKSRHRSTSNDDRIFGLDSVQKELDSGTIAMDLIYPILYPDKEGGILVNVEVQRANVPTDGFCRKVIYVSGLIRNQKGTTYTGTNYSDLWKSYGIWIHTNPPKDRENTYNYVYLIQDSRSTFFYKPEEIDQIGIISIFLGRSRKNETRLHRLLKYAIDPTFTAADRKSTLKEEFKINMTKKMEEVAEMMYQEYAYYFEEEAKKYQFALDSKDQELTAKDQQLAAKDQELIANQTQIHAMEETLFNMVLSIQRNQNISFQEALASSSCPLEMQEKLLLMAQNKGVSTD